MVKKFVINLFVALLFVAIGEAGAQEPETNGKEIRYDQYELKLIVNNDGSITIKFDDGTISNVPSTGEEIMGIYISNPTYPALTVQYQSHRIMAGLGLSISHEGVKGWGTDYAPWREDVPAIRSLQTDQYLCVITYRISKDAYGSFSINVWVKSELFSNDGHVDPGVGCGRVLEVTQEDMKTAFRIVAEMEFNDTVDEPAWLINAAGTNCIQSGEMYTGIYNNERIFELAENAGVWQFEPIGSYSEEVLKGKFKVIEYEFYGGSCTAVQEQR